MIDTEPRRYQIDYFKGRWVKIPLPPKELGNEDLAKSQTLLGHPSRKDHTLAYKHMASNATQTIFPEQLSQADLKELRKKSKYIFREYNESIQKIHIQENR